MNKIKVACLFAGMVDCWHEWEWDAPMTEVVCKKCCMKRAEPTMPDPLHNDGDMRRLEVGMMRHEGWDSFYNWVDCSPQCKDMFMADFVSWLLLDPARFIDLIWDWTGLEKVQKKYGWVECDKKVCAGNTCYNRGCDDWGECKGKVPALWLTERRKSYQG